VSILKQLQVCSY